MPLAVHDIQIILENPNSGQKAIVSKIGDHMLVFSPILSNENDERISATIIDCFDARSVSLILANEKEMNLFRLGFDEADEDTEASNFIREKIDLACRIQGIHHSFLP